MGQGNTGHECRPDSSFGGAARTTTSRLYVCASAEPLAGRCAVGDQNERRGGGGGRGLGSPCQTVTVTAGFLSMFLREFAKML